MPRQKMDPSEKLARRAAYQREYRRRNNEQVCEHGRRSYQKNRDTRIASVKQARQDPSSSNFPPNLTEKRRSDPIAYAFQHVRGSTRRKNLPFDLTLEYIRQIWPADNKCPIFGTEFVIGRKNSTDASASIDRIIPELGYTIGNVHVISMKANRIKNNASAEEIKRVADYLFALR